MIPKPYITPNPKTLNPRSPSKKALRPRLAEGLTAARASARGRIQLGITSSLMDLTLRWHGKQSYSYCLYPSAARIFNNLRCGASWFQEQVTWPTSPEEWVRFVVHAPLDLDVQYDDRMNVTRA